MLYIYRREGVVDVVLSNTSGIPIYVQIEDQIKAAILRGEVSEGEALPSIRALARDLRVSVITTTRAYAELVAGGLVANVPGKGYFVLPRDAELVREQVLREVETHFANGVAVARLADVDDDEIRSILELALTQREDA
ncbi:GntR family transcriptional regulator [Arachnia propionica]|uniref:GntR family transcriptional regulator n=1 Tax=Arachnia propionica TaxID=1750 RepID=UPI001FE4B8A0|nr:GntR family transcriptional regulator [Arachnia propionica]